MRYCHQNQDNSFEFQNILTIIIIISTGMIIILEILASTQYPIALSFVSLSVSKIDKELGHKTRLSGQKVGQIFKLP